VVDVLAPRAADADLLRHAIFELHLVTVDVLQLGALVFQAIRRRQLGKLQLRQAERKSLFFLGGQRDVFNIEHDHDPRTAESLAQ
jgi:hypothetical protein